MKKIGLFILAALIVTAMSSCVSKTPEHKHQYGAEWTTDDAYHWHVCTGEECGEIADKAEHTGGTATETEKAKCEACGVEYGELLAHTHSFGEWETQTPANCNDAEVEIRYCACGESETQTGDAALGHSYTEQVASEDYLATANCGAQATYYYSCACGAKGEETFAYGDVIPHNYDAVVTAPTCTDAGYTTYTCNCGDTYVADEVASIGHNMNLATDGSYHWTACSNGCGVETEKVAHDVVSISAVCNKASAMQYDVLTAADFTVSATCSCGYEYAITEGITLENATLAIGENTVTVKVGEASATVVIEAAKFNVVINGTVKEDTYINSGSGSQDKTYGDNAELSTNGNSFRVFLRYNFTDLITSSYYASYKDEAKVQFTFTMTTGTVALSDAITFKVYPVSESRTSAALADLTWKNYNVDPLALGWGNAYGLIEKVGNSDKVTVDGNKITITVAYREIEEFIDDNGDAIFVFAIWKSSTKVGSIDNATEANRPTVQFVLNEDHIHVYNVENVDEKYFVSANCTEKAKYYYSCSCGEASTAIFENGEVIEHVYSDWAETQAPTCTAEGVNTKTCGKCGDVQTEAIPTIAHNYDAVVTAPTCTEAGYTTYTCACGDSYVGDNVAAKGHTYGDWQNDESYHWKACACGDIIEKATHSGGTATETEQASCETCGVKYGGFASHEHSYSAAVTAPTCTEAGYTTYTCNCGSVYTDNEVAANGHSFGAWATQTPANCNDAEVEIRSCSVCGETETQIGDAALGHDMQTQYDANNHWTACANGCGEATDPVAHFGGEATLTEQAICEGCGQPYGALKEPEKQQYIVDGTVLQDNYVNTSSNGTDYSHKKYLGTDANSVRSYLKIDFSNIIAAVEQDNIAYSDAKVHIVLTACKNPDKSYVLNTFTSAATITFAGFLPGETTTGVDISNTDTKAFTATNVKAGDLYWSNDNSKLVSLLSAKTQAQKPDNIAISDDGLTLTITFTLQELMDKGLIGQDGLGIFTFRCGGMSGAVPVVASLENTGAAGPAVKCEYYK